MIKGRSLYHCHGKKKGKLIKTFKSHKAALKAHRAIMANKKRRKK